MIVTKFYIDNCFHCKHIEKKWNELKNKYDEVIFEEKKIEDSLDPDVAKYNLSIFPAIVINHDPKKKIEGVITDKFLEDFIKEYVG